MTHSRKHPSTKHGRNAEEVIADFWLKMDKRGPDECWLWLHGTCGPKVNGYGCFWDGSKTWRAHRFALSLEGGEKPDLLACHTCDTHLCCNPAHLFWGTSKDNTRDMMLKKRNWTAINGVQTRSVLTPEEVRKIRSLYVPKIFGSRKIAPLFKVSRTVIQRILLRRDWAHLE